MTKLRPWRRLTKHSRVFSAQRLLIREAGALRCQCSEHTDRGLNCGRSDEAAARGCGPDPAH